MVFSSTVFLFVFLPIILILYYNPIFKSREYRNVLLFIASILFYGWGEPIFVALMLLSIVITWGCGLHVRDGEHGKIILIIATLYHVNILFIFKYLMFTVDQLGILLNKNLSIEHIALPIGISFFTFQLMSYLFDIYYHKAEPQRNLLYVGLYVSLFPQLIAGPIVRYVEVEQQIITREERFDDVILGMNRFILGLGKKVLIANYMAQIADNTFDYLSNMSVMMAWLGAIAYTLQIYFDFSGYSDMAIGLGRMFGFRFSENFNYPYIAKSITDFWRRWHISLSSWFRDYVYIPLGGNRVSTVKWIRNLFVVWLLTGIWHGANWTFIAWGLAYFILLLTEKQTGLDQKMGVLSHVYTLICVILLWVLFRAESISTGLVYIGNMFGIDANGFIDQAFFEYIKNTKSVLCIALIGCTPILRKSMEWLEAKKLTIIPTIWTVTIFVFSLLKVISSSYNPFIYFNF